MRLNIQQEELKDKLIEFLKSNEKGFFGIYGAGGCGKTYTLCQSIQNYKGSILFLGATNKVTGVLKDGLNNAGYLNPTIKTIDSFFKFKMKKDFEDKTTISYREPKNNEIPDLIVIDEISLISKTKFEIINKIKHKCKFILIGDYLQLPPIETSKEDSFRNEDGFLVSKIFLSIPKEKTYTLTIQQRQKDGTDLSALISGFRLNMDKHMNPVNIALKKQNDTDVLFYKINSLELKKTIKESNSVAVCYKNQSVLSFNWLIGSTKSMDKGYKLNSINVNDTLMFDSFYKALDTANQKVSFYTADVVEVIYISDYITEIFEIDNPRIKQESKVVKYRIIQVKDKDGRVKEIRHIQGGLSVGSKLSSVISNQRKTSLSNIQKLSLLKNDLEAKAEIKRLKEYLTDLNTRYSNYKNSFASLKRAYAITAHKAQGSTYDSVIIPVYDYSSLNYKDSNQLLYVAMSRAKNKIIFVDKESNFKDNSNRYAFSEFEKMAIASSQDYKCKECENDLLEREFDIDHKIPIANGGFNSLYNLQALCKSCHKRKTAKETYFKNLKK
jgi:hypothetical protein